MPIKYALFENNLTPDPADFSAIVQIAGSWDLPIIADKIVARGSTVGKADVLAVLTDAVSVCEEGVGESNRINFGGLVQLFPRVKGVFTGATDTFDPARHSVDVGANPGGEVRDAVRASATVEKVEAIKPSPNPIEYRDINSDTTNDQVTVGGIGQLSGSRLKYDDSQADEGIYFVATAGGETKVTVVQKNKPAQLVFSVPATLIAGTYNIEVRARIAGGTELRIGRLDPALTV